MSIFDLIEENINLAVKKQKIAKVLLSNLYLYCHCNVSIFPFQMENSRKSYESATQQLVSFLEHVTTMLQATSPSQRKLFEATKAQVN